MKIFMLVLDTLADWEIGYLTAELNSRRLFADPGLDCEIVKVGLSTKPVLTMGGMPITPDVGLDAVRMGADDLLLMPGADTWLAPESAAALRFAKDALEQGRRVAAICGATAGLAQVGALDRRAHTSNVLDYLKMSCPGYTGEQHYQAQPVVRDDNLITASGLAPLEFSHEVFKLLKVFRPDTLEAWFQLHKTREPRYFHAMMASMET
jgi:putative intracellular protease/amidase